MPDFKKPLLLIITGPTASGKTALAVRIALELKCSVLSADSRQVFRELAIGSAAPSNEEMQGVPHYFIASHGISEPFNAGIFAEESLKLLEKLFDQNPVQILCGGTGLYINALINGLNELPEANDELRNSLQQTWEENPSVLLDELRNSDPDFAQEADLNNSRRVLRALEVIRLTGKPYSAQRTGEKRSLFFDYKCFALMPERAVLYEKINNRTPIMLDQGWIEEVRRLKDQRHLNALQTVGYRELFEYLDAKISLDEAAELIKMNTRRYAKRQITWIRNKLNCEWVNPEGAYERILSFVQKERNN